MNPRRRLLRQLTGLIGLAAVPAWAGLAVPTPRQPAGPFYPVEPPLPRMSTTNAENRALTGANTVQSGPSYGLDGTGVTALIYDGGSALAGHQDFSGRLTVIDSDGLSDHATHVAGTVGGDGSINFNHRGMDGSASSQNTINPTRTDTRFGAVRTRPNTPDRLCCESLATADTPGWPTDLQC